MGRAVFADKDGVVGQYKNRRDAHQSREPERRTQIVGEHGKGCAEGAEAAVQLNTVGNRCHREFSDTEVDVSSLRRCCGKRLSIL